MKTILIFNIIGLTVAAVLLTVCFIGWLSAEKKLAKYGESKLFTTKTTKRGGGYEK